MLRLLVALELVACAAPQKPTPCRGVESSHGVCYTQLGQGWTMPELEAREALWLEAMRAHPGAPAALSALNVRVVDFYPACGTDKDLRGCTLGPTLVMVAALPVCRMAAMHEAAHALFSTLGDADYMHTRPEWRPILAAERNCPPLEGAWLERTRQALRTWGIDGGP